MEPTYTKTEDGKLQITETKEVVKEASLEELKNRKEFYLREIASYEGALAEVEVLLTEAGKLGVVEKVEEIREVVEEIPVEISPEKIDEPVESAIVAE